eukprot:PhF_6_TR5650/c0_g1_i1/m.8255
MRRSSGFPANPSSSNNKPSTSTTTDRINKIRESALKMFRSHSTDLTNVSSRQQSVLTLTKRQERIAQVLQEAENSLMRLEASIQEDTKQLNKNKERIQQVDSECGSVGASTALLKDALLMTKRVAALAVNTQVKCHNFATPGTSTTTNNEEQQRLKATINELKEKSESLGRMEKVFENTGRGEGATTPSRDLHSFPSAVECQQFLEDLHRQCEFLLPQSPEDRTTWKALLVRFNRMSSAITSGATAAELCHTLQASQRDVDALQKALSEAAAEYELSSRDLDEAVAVHAKACETERRVREEAQAADITHRATLERHTEVTQHLVSVQRDIGTLTANLSEQRAATQSMQVETIPKALADIESARQAKCLAEESVTSAQQSFEHLQAHVETHRLRLDSLLATQSAEEKTLMSLREESNQLKAHAGHFEMIVRNLAAAADLVGALEVSISARGTSTTSTFLNDSHHLSALTTALSMFESELGLKCSEMGERIQDSMARVVQYDVESEDDVVE